MSGEAECRLEQFIERYSPDVAALGGQVVRDLRMRLPEAEVLVYDNYNALAVGFAPTDKASTVMLSVAFYPRWVSLFLFGGAGWDDPDGLLEGSGTTTRHVKLRGIADFRRSQVDNLIEQALARADPPLDPANVGRVIIKSVSAKQRPRRPA